MSGISSREKCEELLPECKCSGNYWNAEMFCLNVSDFEAFNHILSNGSVFKVNTTFVITLIGNTVLPKGFLSGVIVNWLIVHGSQTQVEEGAFDGVLQLNGIFLTGSSMKEIPDFRAIRSSLGSLYLGNSRLTQLRGDNLKNLTLLWRLSFVNNSIAHVADDVFQGTENVEDFDISHNLLTYLPPSLFRSWKRLKEVRLSYNQLLHVGHLFFGTNVVLIFLNNNNISDLSGVLQDNMERLDTLKLSYNPIERIAPNSFNGKAESIRYLHLDHCLIRELDAQIWNELPHLTELDLSFNKIDKVINRNISKYSDRLKWRSLRLDHNLFTSLGPVLLYNPVWNFSMANNLIAHLGPEDLQGEQTLRHLDLQGNVIAQVERLTFAKVSDQLLSLDLSRNRIKSLQGCLQNLTDLKVLNLSHNRIEVFTPGEFYNMSSLTELHLEGNRITMLDSEIRSLTQLSILSISNNQIQTISTNQIPPKLTHLYLAGNPFYCDCQMLPFLQFLNSSEELTTDEDLCTPSHIRIAPACLPARCPASCRCSCTNDNFILVDCSSSGLTHLPSLFKKEQNSTALEIFLPRANNEMPFVIQAEIEGLNLSGNKIQSLEAARLPIQMRFLFLDHNLIQKPPVSLLESLDFLTRVTLSNNPWTCDCAALDFKKWVVLKSVLVLDVNETRCGSDMPNGPGLAERVIWLLSDRELCPYYTNLYISMGFGFLSFLLGMAGVIIACTRYKMNVKVWLYSHGVTWVKEKDIDKDKEFDAFISFSYKDQDVVIQELIEVIEEKDPDIRLCLHYKHFLPGEFIQRNIMRAVECSKRTVLVLSRNFLESEWCLLEFNAAHAQALKDRVPRIIVIKLPDLPKDDELPKEMQLYIKNTTYLTWGEKHFWRKLLYILPRSQSIPQPESRDDDGRLIPMTDFSA
ncbi:protein toll [Caerostris darwini]|uniref:Protein toll n=1 Tax=Caerostris darwini TaxID=1538125 RepID=A0AAV4SMY4_9ARAC|nr:protein toll [Caerostris darwini]